jgi:hypothetical protein
MYSLFGTITNKMNFTPDKTIDQLVQSITKRLRHPKKQKNRKKQKLDFAETIFLDHLPPDSVLVILQYIDSENFQNRVKTRFGWFHGDPSGKTIHLLFPHVVLTKISPLFFSSLWPPFITILSNIDSLMDTGFVIHKHLENNKHKIDQNKILLVLYRSVPLVDIPIETHCIQLCGKGKLTPWIDVVDASIKNDDRSITSYVRKNNIFRIEVNFGGSKNV